jgi:RNA polymerase sigma-70 factor (ECF subfamily)
MAKRSAPDISDLFPAVYDELRRIARRFLGREREGHTLQPTALVHEAWLRLSNERHADWRGRTHVVAVGAQAMRRLLVDHARGRKRTKRGGDAASVTLHEWLDAADDRPVPIEDALALDRALTTLASIDPRQARIVELRYFGGLTVPEVADELGISVRTVEGEWTHARVWLRRELSRIDT